VIDLFLMSTLIRMQLHGNVSPCILNDNGSLQDRIVEQRFYDEVADEAITVIGITSEPPFALPQYDDGVAWDEGAANFSFDEQVAHRAGLYEYGLDSDRYRPLGPGPRIDQICDPEDHHRFPKPDQIWDGLPSGESRERIPGHPRDFYDRLVRCKRCGLSGSVAGEFDTYGSRGHHQTP